MKVRISLLLAALVGGGLATTGVPAVAQNIITMDTGSLGLTAGPPPPPPCREGRLECAPRTPPFFVPEGLEFHQGSFYIGNVFGGEITRIGPDGSMEIVLPRGSVPEHLSGTFGTDVDAQRGLLHIAAAKFPPDAGLATGQSSLLTIDLASGNLVRAVDLTGVFLNADRPRRTNDVCSLNTRGAGGDPDIFVTDSSNGQIWRIDPNDNVSTFVHSADFDSSPDDMTNRNRIGLNGIVCHPDGYLLTVRFGGPDFSNLFRVDMDGTITEVDISVTAEGAALAFGDGLYLGPNGEMYMVQTFPGGSPAKVVRLTSGDGWSTAALDASVELPAPSGPFAPVGTARDGCAQATTAVIVGAEIFINCAFTATIVRLPLRSFN